MRITANKPTDKGLKPLVLYTPLLFISLTYLFRHFPRESLWYDETVSVYLAQGSWARLWEWTTRLDIHPPLYFIFLKGWMQIAGSSEFSLRMFSLLLAWLACAGMFRLGRLIILEGGIPAMLALLFSGGLLYAAGEVRSYALVLTLAVYSCIFLLQKRFSIAALLTVAALYTHYAALFLWLAQLVFLIGYSPRAIKFMILPALGFLPWLLLLNHNGLPQGLAYPGTISAQTAFSTYWHFFLYGQHIPTAEAIETGNIIAYLVLICMAWGQQKAAFPFLLVAIPLVGMLLGTRLFEAKLAGWHGWLIWLGIPLLIAAAGRLGWLGVAGLMYLSLFTYPPQINSDLRGTFAYLDQHAAPDDVLFLRSGILITAAEYYNTPLQTVPLPDVLVTDVQHKMDFHQAVNLVELHINENTKNIWIISWQGDIMEPQGLAYGLAEYMGGTPLETHQFGDVYLARYRIKRPVTPLFQHIVALPGLAKIHPDGASLLGVDIYHNQNGAGCPVIFHLWWWRGEQDYETIKVSYRLIGANEEIYAQVDHFLGGGFYPQAEWLPFTPTLGRGVVTIPPAAEEVTAYILIYDLAGIQHPQGFVFDQIKVDDAPCEPLFFP